MSRIRGLMSWLSRFPWLSVLVVLIIHAGILAWSATRHSPTWDEPGHLVAGWSHWKFGRFELYSVNPPLVRSIAALPVWLMDPPMDWSDYQPDPKARSEVQLGRQFVKLNGEKSLDGFVMARWACIPFSLLGATICFLWARQAYGSMAGWLALSLWCFSPMILGHGELITPDVGASALGLTATYLFRSWTRSRTWPASVLCGVLLGLCFLAKTTLLALFPLWCVVWWLDRRRRSETESRTGRKSEVAQLALMLAVATCLLNGFYGFRGTGTPLREFRFMSDLLCGPSNTRDHHWQGNRFESSWLGTLPVPVPRDFLLGIDIQRRDFERGYVERAWWSYWNGEWKPGGWWYYYVAGFLLKEPVGLWLLLALLIALKIGRRCESTGRENMFLLIPLLGVLLLVSSQMGMSRHLRYALPAYPFLLVFVSQVGRVLQRDNAPSGEPLSIDARSGQTSGSLKLLLTARQSVLKLSVIGAWVWFVGAGALSCPHSLAYFNELAGGSSQGSRWLIGSNLDWGQDLLFLRDWQRQHPDAKPLRLAYFGPIDPKWVGIDYQLPAPLPSDFASRPLAAQRALGPQPGFYAISETLLAGDLMPVPDSEGTFRYFNQPVFTYLKSLKPIARTGSGLMIFLLTEEETNALRRRLKLPKLH